MRFLSAIASVLLIASPLNGSIEPGTGAGASSTQEHLAGRLLVAEPTMRDPRFRQTVIFMVRHDESGALGLIVNRALQPVKIAAVVEGIGGDPEGIEGKVQLHYGGPVDPSRLFVLHSTDYEPVMIPVNDQYGVTMSEEILRAMAQGKGPERALLAIGYAGWAGGQLEVELKRGDWAIAPAEPEIVFDGNYDTKWERAQERRYLKT